MTTKPTEDQADTIRHSLGLNRTTQAYRNYFCVADNDPECEALVAAGWMQRGRTINQGRDRIYLVTEAGASAVNAKLPAEENRDDGWGQLARSAL